MSRVNSKIKNNRIFSTKRCFHKRITTDDISIPATPCVGVNKYGVKLTFTAASNHNNSSINNNNILLQDGNNVVNKTLSKSSKIMEYLYDYTPLPSKKIQSKINYFMTPYNNLVIHEKFMNFKYIDNTVPKEKPEFMTQSSNHWNQISDLILNNNHKLLDQTLNSVNDGLYRVLENKMRDEPSVFKKKIKKHITKKSIDFTTNAVPILLEKYRVENTPVSTKLAQTIIPKRNIITQSSIEVPRITKVNEKKICKKQIKNWSKCIRFGQKQNKYLEIQKLFKNQSREKETTVSSIQKSMTQGSVLELRI